MKNFNKKITALIFASFLLITSQVQALKMPDYDRDILFEGKAAVFVPTNDTLKDIYNNCADFGLEVTGRMFDRLYAFSGVDFLRKNSYTTELASPTQLSIVNLALGAKYFLPFSHGDFYFGVGIAPTFLCTDDRTPEPLHQTQWSCGGIAKTGLIVDLPRSLFLDFYFNYSFVKSNSYSNSPPQLQETHLDGYLFGIGFGYRFH